MIRIRTTSILQFDSYTLQYTTNQSVAESSSQFCDTLYHRYFTCQSETSKFDVSKEHNLSAPASKFPVYVSKKLSTQCNSCSVIMKVVIVVDLKRIKNCACTSEQPPELPPVEEFEVKAAAAPKQIESAPPTGDQQELDGFRECYCCPQGNKAPALEGCDCVDNPAPPIGAGEYPYGPPPFIEGVEPGPEEIPQRDRVSQRSASFGDAEPVEEPPRNSRIYSGPIRERSAVYPEPEPQGSRFYSEPVIREESRISSRPRGDSFSEPVRENSQTYPQSIMAQPSARLRETMRPCTQLSAEEGPCACMAQTGPSRVTIRQPSPSQEQYQYPYPPDTERRASVGSRTGVMVVPAGGSRTATSRPPSQSQFVQRPPSGTSYVRPASQTNQAPYISRSRTAPTASQEGQMIIEGIPSRPSQSQSAYQQGYQQGPDPYQSRSGAVQDQGQMRSPSQSPYYTPSQQISPIRSGTNSQTAYRTPSQASYRSGRNDQQPFVASTPAPYYSRTSVTQADARGSYQVPQSPATSPSTSRYYEYEGPSSPTRDAPVQSSEFLITQDNSTQMRTAKDTPVYFDELEEVNTLNRRDSSSGMLNESDMLLEQAGGGVEAGKKVAIEDSSSEDEGCGFLCCGYNSKKEKKPTSSN